MTFARGEAWTDERLAKLKELWPNKALSAAAIASILGGDLTRNAVIGKAKRIGLEKRPPVNPPKPSERRRHRTKPSGGMFVAARGPVFQRVEIALADAKIPLDQRKTIFELENHHCRWPVGDVGQPGFFFCGHPSADLAEKRPYCAEHQARSTESRKFKIDASGFIPRPEAPRPQEGVPQPNPRSPAAKSFTSANP